MHRSLACAVLGAATLLAAAPAASAATPHAAASTAAVSTAAVSTAAPTPLAGVAVYAAYDRGYTVTRYGGRPAELGKPGQSAQFAASPDGRKVAWITSGGRLQVRDGGRTRTVARGLQGDIPCLSPVWSPDSRRVAYVGGNGSQVRVVGADGRGARVLGRTAGPCHLAWSPDGRYLAGYAGTTEGVHRLDTRTGRSVKVKGVKLANHVQSLSPGGRHVVVSTLRPTDPGGDGVWPTSFTPTLVDTATGRRVPIGVKGRLLGAFHLPDGRLAVRVAGRTANTLVVLDAKGRQVQRLAEPAAAKDQALLQVVR
ncbi:hypothetical protein [Nonomuraea sp. NPDC023979]|uniref:hypothetical protein n=1 Tax=Nonomuraea sp. NPDC023979 TaxID=3154796 RepID=UPI00340A7090